MLVKRLALAILALCVLFLAGCCEIPVLKKDPVTLETAAPSPEATAEPSPTPEPPPEPVPTWSPTPEPGASIELNTDELLFEHKGEKAEIYAGQVDLIRVNWYTDDPEVAIVSEGTVMSIGPGETTIRARYEDQEVQCRVVCTAPEDEYVLLDENMIHAPLLNPPVLTEEEDARAREFFADTAFLGDSVSYVFCQWETKEDWLGDVTFLARGGISVQSAVTGRRMIYYQGMQTTYPEALASCGAKKAFIMMGTNDIGQFGVEGSFGYFKQFVDKILERNPDVEIYIQSLTPIWIKAECPGFTNELFDEYNVLLRQYAEEMGFHFVDLAPYFKDYTNGLALRYESDQSVHFTREGCYVWAQVLKAYALEQLSEEVQP